MRTCWARMSDVTAAIARDGSASQRASQWRRASAIGSMRSGLTTPAIMAGRGLLYCGRMPGTRPRDRARSSRSGRRAAAASLDAAEVENGGSWSQVRLSDAALPGLAATGLRFREVALARVDLAGARLINLAFADVELDTCNLATSTRAAARCAA